MPSATTPKQITLPFFPEDSYIFDSYSTLKNWTQDKSPDIWIHSIEQILTPFFESEWTLIQTLLKHKQQPKINILISKLLQYNKITLLIKEKTTPDWKGISKHPLHKKPSQIFPNEYITTLQYQTTHT